MKRILSFLCMLAMLLSVINPAAFAAEETNSTEGIVVLEDDASNVTVNHDTIIDLNGHNLDGVTVTGGTLYCMDSQTADYTVADGVYGHLTNVTGNVEAAEGYLQVGDSFHAVNLDIYAMTLRASDVGVYYKSNFAADEVVAAQVESFGVALSVVTAPNADNLETYCGYSVFTGFEAGEGANATGTSTLLKGIMKAANSDSKNEKNAAMPIYGRAYIKTAAGYVFGETVKRSLQEQVEAIDKVWNKLTDAQKTPVLAMLEGYTTVMEKWNIPNIRGIQVPGAEVEIEIPVEVTAENGVVTEAVTVEMDGVSVTVPAGTKLVEGADGLTVIVTEKETSEAGLTLEESEVLMPMDVHVDGLAADNTAPLTIFLGKVMAENLNMGNYAVYHVENGKANEMVLIPTTAEFTAHNQYKYTLDGELTLYMATFSEVAVVSEEPKWEGNRDYSWYTKNPNADVFEIRNADQLAGFGAIVGGMDGQTQNSFAGKTIKLLANISIGDLTDEDGRKAPDGSNLVFYPIGYNSNDGTYIKTPGKTISTGFYSFEGIFDGNGNTISNFYQNTWEMKGDHNWYSMNEQYYRDGFGLFGHLNGATVKNLTIDNFKCDSEIGTTGVVAAYADSTAENSVTFENIAITNSNPRVYNIGNGGIVGSTGYYSEAGAQHIILKNITVDDTNKISALWGSWDVGCGGLVGRYYPDAYADAEYGIKFTNCHVAAQIDVNNDVCGNYQYYWYRYCGMVIGTVEKSTAEGGADLTGIVAENCTVNFGDRHEYYYCEFVKNSIASYTHDYQFSRVDNADITITNGVPSCNHDHAARGTEVIDGETVLVEDKQAVYLPFRQLFGGNGWGIKGVDEYDNIDISTISKSIVKFETVENAPVRYLNAETNQEKATVKVGQLFKSADNKEYPIVANNVQVFVSPADKNSTVSAVYNAAADWTQGTLTFYGSGDAIVSITDYQYCLPTILRISVNDYYYTITYVKDGVVEKVQPVKDNSVPYSDWYEIPNESRVYQWVNAASVAAKPIPAGNQKDITLYVDWADIYTARFLYQDGSLYKEIDFDNQTGKMNENEPGVPAVSGLISNGWEPYTLKGAKGDVTIKPIYKCNEFVQLEPVDTDNDGITNFYRVVGSTIVGKNVDIIIPDYIDSNGATIEEIATGAFEDGDLRDVHIPNSVKRIGKNAFTKNSLFEYPQIQIIYDGTQAEWDALEKATGWDDNIGSNSVVVCECEEPLGYYKKKSSYRTGWTWTIGQLDWYPRTETNA